MSQDLLTVSELCEHIKLSLDNNPIFQNTSVCGEVADYRQSSQGHCYFTLRDSLSSIRCVMFKGYARKSQVHLWNGVQIIAKCNVALYSARGDIQLFTTAALSYGEGDLQQEVLNLKHKLKDSGFFDDSRKRSVPKFPECIAIITSKEGAALQDILNILKRRYPICSVVIVPALMQGAQAPESIVRAFNTLDQIQNTDLCILARGGGSLQDLMAFNNESVARAVMSCKVPVVSGIGHEIDTTIADLTADIHAPTPSAAAEIATPDIAQLSNAVNNLCKAVNVAMKKNIDRHTTNLYISIDRLQTSVPKLSPKIALIDKLLQQITILTDHTIKLKKSDLNIVLSHLKLSAIGTLNRGYSITTTDNGSKLTNSKQVSVGDTLNIRLADGYIRVKIKEVFV